MRGALRGPSILGAAIALALDAALAAVGIIVGATISPELAFWPTFAATSSAVGAPLLGWILGPAVVRSEPLPVGRSIAVGAAAFTFGYVVFTLAGLILAGLPGGPGTEIGFLLYAAAWSPVAVAVTLLFAIPLSVIWVRAVRVVVNRWGAASSGH